MFYKELGQFFGTELFAGSDLIVVLAQPMNKIENTILIFQLGYIDKEINAYILPLCSGIDKSCKTPSFFNQRP